VGSAAWFLPPDGEPRATLPELRSRLVEKLTRLLQGLVLVLGPTQPPTDLIERCADGWERALRRHAGHGGAGQLWLAQLYLGAVQAAAGTAALRSLRLDRPLTRAMREAGLDEDAAQRQAALALVLAAREPAPGPASGGAPLLAEAGAGRPSGGTLARSTLRLLGDEYARAFLRVHEYGGTTWFDKQRFEDLVGGLALCEGDQQDDRTGPQPGAAQADARSDPNAQALLQIAAGCGYRLDELVRALQPWQPPS
jgi:hypothetical protein